MAATPPPLMLDTPALDFRLPGTDGRTHTLDTIAGANGTVIVFICNHCPYVKAVIDRLVADAHVLMAEVSVSRQSAATTPTPTPRTRSRRCSASRRHMRFRSPICMTRISRSRGPMAPSARPTSSAMTRTADCKYRGRLDEGRTRRRQPARGGNCWKRCEPLPRPARRRLGKCHRSAAPSNGRPPRKAGRYATTVLPCPHSRLNLLPIITRRFTSGCNMPPGALVAQDNADYCPAG